MGGAVEGAARSVGAIRVAGRRVARPVAGGQAPEAAVRPVASGGDAADAAVGLGARPGGVRPEFAVVQQVQTVLEDEQPQVGAAEAQAARLPFKRPQRPQARRRQGAAPVRPGPQNVKENRLAVEPIPSTAELPTIGPLAVTQQTAGGGPAPPVDAAVEAVGQRRQRGVAQERRGPEGARRQPAGLDRAAYVRPADLQSVGIDEVRKDAVVVRQPVQGGPQAGGDAPGGVGGGQKAERRGGGQSKRDEAHPRRGQAAKAAPPARAEIALPVAYEAVAGLVVEEVAQGLLLQPEKEGPVAHRRGRRRSKDHGAPAGCGRRAEPGGHAAANRPPFRGQRKEL